MSLDLHKYINRHSELKTVARGACSMRARARARACLFISGFPTLLKPVFERLLCLNFPCSISSLLTADEKDKSRAYV